MESSRSKDTKRRQAIRNTGLGNFKPEKIKISVMILSNYSIMLKIPKSETTTQFT